MSERFFLETPPAGSKAVLTGDEARHLARVLRATVGDEVTVFDGRGRSWAARVKAIGRDTVELETGEPRVEPAGGRVLTVAVALPKGERQKWLVEKLTELGVARLVPLVTERGVIEASKQCGRSTLMEIGAPASVAAVVASRAAAAIGLVADPCGQPLDAAGWPATTEVIALVGPEGGFSQAELALAEAAGWPRIALGHYVLRIETAAVALAARLAN